MKTFKLKSGEPSDKSWGFSCKKMKKEDFLFLNQLIASLEEAERNLERAYEKRNYEKFNKSKKIMLRIQNEISNIIKWQLKTV